MSIEDDMQKCFKYVMSRVHDTILPQSEYGKGLKKLELMLHQVDANAIMLDINMENVKQNANWLEAEYDRDILPALDHIGTLTHPSAFNSKNKREEYLTAVVCWAKIAEQYLKRNERMAGTSALR